MRSLRSIRAATRSRPRAAALVALALAATVPVALAADASSERLRTQGERLEQTAQSVTLELYGLESQLARARAETAALTAKRAAVQAERDRTRRSLAVAARAAQVSQERLQELVRELYAQDALDPLAILLGAGSVDEALTSLENLDRSATQTIRIGEQATAARQRLARLGARLAARTAELEVVTERARARAAELEQRAAERAAYLATIRYEAALTQRQLAQVQEQARAAQRRTAALQVASAPAPASQQEPAPAASAAEAPPAAEPTEPVSSVGGARTMRVTAVAYILEGRTASGLPTGPGIVAVDPAVIPLGTRFHVPGYGDAVAADTGGAIRGAMIDVWFPTLEQARAWGRRSVVITFR